MSTGSRLEDGSSITEEMGKSESETAYQIDITTDCTSVFERSQAQHAIVPGLYRLHSDAGTRRRVMYHARRGWRRHRTFACHRQQITHAHILPLRTVIVSVNILQGAARPCLHRRDSCRKQQAKHCKNHEYQPPSSHVFSSICLQRYNDLSINANYFFVALSICSMTPIL